jgi:hypothetical protein
VSGHTPGEWRFVTAQYNGPQTGDDKVGSIVAVDGDGDPWYVAEVCGDVPEWEANAALLKAAPDLLAILKKVDWRGGDCYDSGFCPSCGNLPVEAHAADCALSAAIAKAEGR